MRKFSLLIGLVVAAGSAWAEPFVFGFTPNGIQTLSVTTTTGVFEFTAFDTGWYNVAGFHNPNITNYFAGSAASDSNCSVGCNDFFAFRLGNGTITGTIQSATLSVGNPGNGYQGPPGSATMELWEVSTLVSTLIAGGNGLVAIFADLGTGTSFGSRSVSVADNGTQIVFNLNNAALNAIAAAGGINGASLFAIGGSLTAVPEPSTWVLMGSSLLAILARRRRR